MDWSGADYLWIIVMFILTAPIHCTGSIGRCVATLIWGFAWTTRGQRVCEWTETAAVSLRCGHVSPALAKAVTSTYPSPSLLLQAYEELSSEEGRRRLLADLAVVGGAKERRVGPELAGRIHRLLTSQNPHLLLD